MAAKKTKKKAAPKKAAPKKKAAAKAKPKTGTAIKPPKKTKKAAPRKRKPKGPFVVIPNHRFAPGTEVGFHPAFMVEVERSLGREPMPAPVKTVKVKARGLLEVNGLTKGQWVAAGLVGERWAYVSFPVS